MRKKVQVLFQGLGRRGVERIRVGREARYKGRGGGYGIANKG